MENNTMPQNESNDDNFGLTFLFFYLLFYNDASIDKEWNEFAYEIKSKSRYFPKSTILKKIKELSRFAKSELKKGTVLYRARLYNSSYDFAKEVIKDIVPIVKEKFPNESLPDDGTFDMKKLSFLYNMGENESIYEKIAKLKGGTEFYGYNEDGSDAPKPSGSSGRANAINISFLYASEEAETAMMEVSPKLRQEISLAEIELTRDVTVFDFSRSPQTPTTEEQSMSIDLMALSDCFARPNYGDDFEYVPTQYVCEYIRELKFGGIRFQSAIKSDGTNIVLFDTEKNTKPYVVKNSKVMRAKDIKIEFEQIVPPSE